LVGEATIAQFLFNMFNHNDLGQRSLEDVIAIVGHQLMALGHKAVWKPDNKGFLNHSSGINVVVEGFTPSSVKLLADVYNQGGRFIILATEEPTPKGFNWGTQDEMIRRQKCFPEIRPFVEGIIHLVPNNPNDPINPGNNVTGWYGQTAPAAYAELGFAQTLLRLSQPDPYKIERLNKATGKMELMEPEFDFGFFGSLSGRRKQLLTRLAKRIRSEKAVRVVADFPDQVKRDNGMKNSKVLIQTRKFHQMGLVSSSRCNTALCIGRPVIAEPHWLSEPWDKIVHFSKSDEDFYDEAIFILANWKEYHKQQLRRFAELLPPDKCIGEPLRKIGFREIVERAA
jgi:hypothetical protein